MERKTASLQKAKFIKRSKRLCKYICLSINSNVLEVKLSLESWRLRISTVFWAKRLQSLLKA